MGNLAAGPGIEKFNFFCCWSLSRWFANFNNLSITTKKLPSKSSPKKVSNHHGWTGGGLAEYPAVHLKEAIQIPIVLLDLVELQCYIVGIYMNTLPGPSFGYLKPDPLPHQGEKTTHGRPSTKLLTIHICGNLLPTFGCQYILQSRATRHVCQVWKVGQLWGRRPIWSPLSF